MWDPFNRKRFFFGDFLFKNIFKFLDFASFEGLRFLKIFSNFLKNFGKLLFTDLLFPPQVFSYEFTEWSYIHMTKGDL